MSPALTKGFSDLNIIRESADYFGYSRSSNVLHCE